MNCFSPVRLYIDGEYNWLDSIQLLGGESLLYGFTGDGRTWRLEVDQHPLHPGNSIPSATIERCGNPSNWTPGLVNILPHDDLDPIKDLYCGTVTGSYDPNDKTGYPLGVGDNHFITPNGKIDYLIRFQNTGSDTALTVVIRDTLDFDLDIFSVKSCVASHPYNFQMYGPRILEWTFHNILLPDSTTNEPASNGFVTFTVKQLPNLPDNTVINNSVGIYFDFNDPIITNTSNHTISRELESLSWEETSSITFSSCDEIDYNGFIYTQTGEYYQLIEGITTDTLVILNITNNSSFGIDTQTACESYTWIDGNTYNSSNNFVTHALTNLAGCDSIVTLNLTLNNSTTGIDVRSVCEGLTWIDGNTYTESTNDPTWTLPNSSGCDSIVTLNLIVNNSTSGIDVQTTCESLTWLDGNTYTESTNIPTWTLPNSLGCDSIVTLNLTINNSTGIDIQTACESFTWIDNLTYTSSNNSATHLLTNSLGCDSLIFLDLTIINPTFGTDIQLACDSLTWIDGITYTTSTNSPTWILSNSQGCDSILTLDLNIKTSTYGVDIQTHCETFTWIDGNTYNASNNFVTHTLTNSVGCDSIVTLNLTVNNSSNGTDIQTACESFTWIDGNTYFTNNNSAIHILTNSVGCDSIVTLNLTINNPTNGIDVQTACGNFDWIDGNTYNTTNNTATHILTNSLGCDSVVTLNLTINNVSDITTTLSGVTITSNSPTATYQWLDCDNNFSSISNETAQSFTPADNGNYAVQLTENGCIDTTACAAIITVGILKNSFTNDFILFPNPTDGLVKLIFENEQQELSVSLFSITGELIENKKYQNSSVITFDVKGAPGVYLLKINSNSEEATIRILKE